MNRHPFALGALALALLAVPACAQTPGSAAARGQDSAGGSTPDSVQARASRARIKGRENAPVTIVEVSDFQCPYCRQFAVETYRQLDSAYVKTGKAKLIFISYPIPSHPQAWAAAEAAACAGAQDAFWPMHDRIFATQKEWGGAGAGDPSQRFAGFAAELKLDAAAFRRCVQEDQAAPVLVNDVMQASGSGINSTPTFIFNGQQAISGAQPFSEFARIIDGLLAGAPAAPQATPPVPGAPRP